MRKVMELEKLLVSTTNEDICKMMHTTGFCEATVIVRDNEMAYVLPTSGNESQGIAMPLIKLLEDCDSYTQLDGSGYSVDVVIDGPKTVKNMRECAVEPISRKSLAKMLGIPNITLEQWENDKRTPPTYVINLIEYWLRNEGYLKRRFSFGLLTYDEDTTEYSDVLDWDWQGDDIYADTVEEAIDLALDYLLENISGLNKEVFLSDLDDDDMRVFSDEYGCGLYRRNDKPFTFGDGELLWGVKRTKNNRIEYYRIVEDDDDPKEYRCELARTVYFGAIHEHILGN